MIATSTAAAAVNLNIFDLSPLLTSAGLIALLTLSVLEIVLGIDNIVFLSILVDKLPPEQRSRARFLGLLLAMVARVLLLLSITWVMKLTEPLFSVFGHAVDGKALVLVLGGLFLIRQSTKEIHEKLEGDPEGHVRDSVKSGASFGSVLVQIALLDIVFSLDSVVTAVGMAQDVSIMILAVLLAIGFMMLFAGAVSAFVNKHPTVKMLALSFLLMIGMALVGEGAGMHIPKGYIYFAMAFSMFVELLNLRARKKSASGTQH